MSVTSNWKETATKTLIKPGTLKRRPGDCSTVCVVIKPAVEVVPEEIEFNKTLSWVLGDANSYLDRMIEYFIKQLRPGEQCLFQCSDESRCYNFNIELLSTEEKPFIFEWDDEDKVKYVGRFKSQGVELFNKGQYNSAFNKFQKALRLLLTFQCIVENEITTEAKALKIALYNNIANCHIKFKNFKIFVPQLCLKILNLDENNIKANFRKALADIEVKNYDSAEFHLQCVLRMEPHNKAVKDKLDYLKQLRKEYYVSVKSMAKKMFPY